jgi:hypothetical protein
LVDLIHLRLLIFFFLCYANSLFGISSSSFGIADYSSG